MWIHSSTRFRKTCFKTIGVCGDYELLLSTNYIHESETAEFVCRSINSTVDCYDIASTKGQIVSIVHDSAANVCAGVRLFIQTHNTDIRSCNCNFHLFKIQHDEFIVATGIDVIIAFVNSIFPTHAKSRIEHWTDYLQKKGFTLPLPASTNTTRKIIGWRNNMSWLITKLGDQTVLSLLYKWLELRNSLSLDKETEAKFLLYLDEHSIKFWETLILVTLRVTNNLALMVKLCQSKTFPAGHLIQSFYISLTKYFKEIQSLDHLCSIDQSIREEYNNLNAGK